MKIIEIKRIVFNGDAIVDVTVALKVKAQEVNRLLTEKDPEVAPAD